jgi:hypothetical protein
MIQVGIVQHTSKVRECDKKAAKVNFTFDFVSRQVHTFVTIGVQAFIT